MLHLMLSELVGIAGGVGKSLRQVNGMYRRGISS
jgi:hypothetical protein